MLIASTPTIQTGDPYLEAAERIGERFWTYNAMSAQPTSTSRYVPISLLVGLWGTPEAGAERLAIYTRAIGLALSRSGRSRRRTALNRHRERTERTEPGSYAGIIMSWVERDMDLPAAELITLSDTALKVLKWTRANVPEISLDFASDVILSMVGYFGLPDIELITPEDIAREIAERRPDGITTPTQDQLEDREKPSGALFWIGSFVAGVVLVVLVRGRSKL